MNRRNLIMKCSSTAITGCSIIPHSGLTSSAESDENNCTNTLPQIEGPYYQANLTDTIDMTEGASKGIGTLHGQCKDTRCTPVANAKIDSWHAIENGD